MTHPHSKLETASHRVEHDLDAVVGTLAVVTPRLAASWAPLLVCVASACAPSAPPDARALAPADTALLPAYAHNDYRNARPLEAALALGLRGVEVDCFLVNGRFLVGHDRFALDTSRTLERLYLDPLRDHVRRHGTVLPGGEPLLMNIELKTDGQAAFNALHELLASYRELFTVVEDGTMRPGPVRVILVGWQPPLEWLARQSPRFVAVQRHARELWADHAEYPSHLLALVSAEYEQLSRWQGLGPPPAGLLEQLDHLAETAHRVPGRLLRVYAVPVNSVVYRTLLTGGVDLIGVDDLERGYAALLQAARAAVSR